LIQPKVRSVGGAPVRRFRKAATTCQKILNTKYKVRIQSEIQNQTILHAERQRGVSLRAERASPGF
jgi:hypothetical protein